MHTLVVVENISLDGVIQSPAAADEDTRGGFAHGGWANRLLAADPEAATAALSRGGDAVAMLFGRRTYDHLVGHWLTTPDPNPFTEILTVTPKYVVTRDNAAEAPYPNSTVLVGEAVGTVRALKEAGDGDIVVLGSGALVRALAAAGLVDRYVLTVLPVVLGQGARLFDSTYADLRVEWSTTSATGIVTASYRVGAS